MAKRKRTETQEILRLKKVPTVVYLEEDQSKRLKELSARTRVPQQVYIREGVEYVLQYYSTARGVLADHLERRRMARLRK